MRHAPQAPFAPLNPSRDAPFRHGQASQNLFGGVDFMVVGMVWVRDYPIGVGPYFRGGSGPISPYNVNAYAYSEAQGLHPGQIFRAA